MIRLIIRAVPSQLAFRDPVLDHGGDSRVYVSLGQQAVFEVFSGLLITVKTPPFLFLRFVAT
jgi:hypothetical protein